MRSGKNMAHEPRVAPINVKALTAGLTDPFDLSEVHFKPGAVSGNRALALAYVNARAIQDRLDEVLGVDGWQDDYEHLPDGSVVCRLRLRLGEEWVTKVDVGGPSGQSDSGDRVKAAFSDALKRAAVKFGIGRYLYRLPAQWTDYDPKRRQFTRTPTLPDFALPRRKTSDRADAPSKTMRAGGSSAASPHSAKDETAHLPANGTELQERLSKYEARLVCNGVCKPGDLMKFVLEAGTRGGFPVDMRAWPTAAIELAAQEAKRFETQAKGLGSKKDVA
jgi:hypothetical protein